MRIRLFVTFLRDLFAVLPVGPDAAWNDFRELRPGRKTVVLVTGFAATRRSVSAMRKRLLKDNCNVLVLAMDWHRLSDGVRGLYAMAEELSGLCVKLRKDPRCVNQPLYLVSHSAGGLVARYYVQRLGGDAYCDAIVTMGTPHRGTWIAAPGFLTHLILKAGSLWHMLPPSRFLKEVNAALWPTQCRWLTIGSRGDLLCPPRTTQPPDAVRKSAEGELRSVLYEDLSHSEYLLSKRVYQEIATFLGFASMQPSLSRSDVDSA